jgi:hypothetical protein
MAADAAARRRREEQLRAERWGRQKQRGTTSEGRVAYGLPAYGRILGLGYSSAVGHTIRHAWALRHS